MNKRHRWLRTLVSAVALLSLAWVAVTIVRIERQSWRDEAHPADCIVVFGAAEYSGRPSPVLRARLDHAFNLFQRGLAPVVITTGGYGGDPRFSEGGVGRVYLMGRGVPEADIIAETQADNTDQSVERVAAIMNENGMHTCIAVSDSYHIFRIKKMLEHHGFTVCGAPRPQTRAPSGWHETVLILREVVSYTLWRIESLGH
ncbi:MAG TPA: YdcF family protein [Terriglobales bacterium]|nr:YdcF family protein [Terriglobales bacterium]